MQKVVENFNEFFGNIIKFWRMFWRMIQNSIIAVIEKYKRHPSILKIKQKGIENYFDLKHIDDKKWLG